MPAAASPANALVKPATCARPGARLAHIVHAFRRGSSPHAWRGVVWAIIISCAFACPDRVAAQALWRGLNLGASPNSVRQSFPSARPPAVVETLADGETDELVTNAFFEGDRFMEVRFFFREGGLTAVMLSPAAIDPSRANLGGAEAMAGRLTARYGAPFDCGDKSFARVGLYECKWLAAPIVIRLWYLDVLGQSPSMRIVFRKADDAAYDF